MSNDTPSSEAVGTLEPEEMETIQKLNLQSRTLLIQLGQLDMQKHQLRQSLDRVQLETQQLNQAIISRLGLSESTSLSVNTDGQVFVVKES